MRPFTFDREWFAPIAREAHSGPSRAGQSEKQTNKPAICFHLASLKVEEYWT
jgi:hypothetical protein